MDKLDRPKFKLRRLRPGAAHRYGLTWDEQIPMNYRDRKLRKNDVNLLKQLQEILEPGFLYAFTHIAEVLDYHYYPLGFLLVRLWVNNVIQRAYGTIQRQGDGPIKRDGKRHFLYYFIPPKKVTLA